MKLLIEKNNHRTKLKRKKRQKIYIERESGCKNIFLWPELSVSLLLKELQPICLLRVTSNISAKVSGSAVGMQTSVSGWKCWMALMVLDSLCFAFCAPVAPHLFEISKLLPAPACEGVSTCAETFTPSQLPSQFLSLFSFSYFFPPNLISNLPLCGD